MNLFRLPWEDTKKKVTALKKTVWEPQNIMKKTSQQLSTVDGASCSGSVLGPRLLAII